MWNQNENVDDAVSIGTQIMPGHGEALSSVTLEAVRDAVCTQGFLVLRGFDVDRPGFERFTKRFSRRFLVHGNPERAQINEDDTTQEVQPGRFPIPLHLERGTTPFAPDLYWFFCERPAGAGGETTFCDGQKLYQALGASTLAFFREHLVRWHNYFPAPAWKRAYGLASRAQAEQMLQALGTTIPGLQYRFGEEDGLMLSFATTAIRRSKHCGRDVFANSLMMRDSLRSMYHATLEDGAAIPAAVYDEIEDEAAQLTYQHRWQAGDIIVVDNTRVMHGRRAFSDPDRRIYVRMCDAEW